MKNDTPFAHLIKKYFGFLETEYGFEYIEGKQIFESGSARVEIDQADYTTPSIKIWFKSEPKFTTLDLNWLLADKIKNDITDKNLLEDNLAYYGNLLRVNFIEMSSNRDNLLLAGLKRLFISECKLHKIHKENLQREIDGTKSSDLRKLYYFIKSKDRFWEPAKDL